ncbi:RNA-binding protein 12-like [Helianthus annuus]|uniref:RNA-binding protein 12-like n=1 Tax=Helianthus annuus TaxID=4232 RepID=UPI001652D1BC|nr:RNA-binding protein 12-like [Helianthus annuus]
MSYLVVIPPEAWPIDDLFKGDVNLYVDGRPVDAQGDGEIDEDVVAVPPPVVPVMEISSDTSLHPVSDSFESVTSSALQVAGLQLFATDFANDTAMSVALSLARDPTPPHDLEPTPELAPVPFDIAPLIPDPAPAPVDPPFVEPFIPAPAPADVAPLPPIESDVHRTNLPTIFLQDIPAPRPGEGTSGQHPRDDPFAPATFPPTS